ncbi:MAG TPA: acyl-CoA carboxylase subunit epsilon [Jatrophihabitans sp.]|nr:acyl-CoA carboxylase subunit epsilon [Jatrophihabitans sp.]
MTADRPDEEQPDELADSRPVLRIVAGNPTDAELAAVTAVLLSRAAGTGTADPPTRPTGWSDLSLRLRQPPPAGPDAWRNSRWV